MGHREPYLPAPGFTFYLGGDLRLRRQTETEAKVGILWIILIVVLVLALLGFFSRGSW